MTGNNPKRNQPSDRDHQSRHRLQEKVSNSYVQFYGPVYLSIGLEAKRDIYNTFNPDRPISVHLDSPPTEKPPLAEIKQEGKNSIKTADFYFTNKESLSIVVPTPCPNNATPTGDKAAAADPTLFEVDPLQPGKICLHSWMLYTLQAPILDLTDKDIKSMQDFEQAFHALNLCSTEDNKDMPNGRKETGSTNKSK